MAGETETGRPFIGREEALEALRSRLEELQAGVGGVTLLVGDTGVGKSALIIEFIEYAVARGTRVLVGRAPAQDDPPPFSLLHSAIESAREPPGPGSEDGPGARAPLAMIGFAPGLGETEFPTPVGIEARLLDALAGTPAPGATSRGQVLAGIADRILEVTRHGPTVLVLEDLPRADKSSLTAVEFFANELQDRPLWILATARPNASLAAAGRARMEAFETATRAARVALRPMNSNETATYLRRNDPGREVSLDEVTRRYSETGGNPLLLRQLARPPSSRGDTALAERGTTLSDPARHVLEIASVLGPAFPFGLLLRASAEDEERLAETVDALVGAGLLFARPGEVLEFPEERLREETYRDFPERRRRLLHRQAGVALEGMGETDPSRIFALARHFYLGHDRSRSVRYNRIAAEIAERALAPEAAWEHLTRALESHREMAPDDADGASELVLDLARVTEELGLLRDAETILREFLDHEADHSRLSPARRATVEIFLARVLTGEGDVPAAAEIAERVLRTPGLEHEPLVLVGAHRHVGMALYYAGRYPEALTHHTEEIRLAREVGNELVLARAQIWRVAVLQMMGETQQAIAEARAVTVARDRFGSARESAQAHLFLGDILADARSPPSDRQDALGEFAQAIRFAETAKDPRRIAWPLYKSAELLREAGQLDEALERLRRAGDIFAKIGDQVGWSVTLKVRGQIATDRGAFEVAETDLLEAQRVLESLNHTLEELDVVLRLAQLCWARGDLDGARRYVADLERRRLLLVRPDLAAEFNHLTNALGERNGRAP